MTDFLYGDIIGDLRVADQAFAAASRQGDPLAQQRACAFALAAVQRAFPVGLEFKALMRVSAGLQRVIDGRTDPLFVPTTSGRRRPTPERQMDGLIVASVRLYTEAGLSRTGAFKKVAQIFSAAGATSHGGGRSVDSDNHGISRAVTEGSVKTLWNASRKGKRLEPVGQYADETVVLMRRAGIATGTVAELDAVFSVSIADIVDLLTTPSASDPAE